MTTNFASADTAIETKPPAPAVDNVTKEIRFAIVMYGGVSLAIYINGVAQELLHMVRSTALVNTDANSSNSTQIDYDQLSSTERVYRKVSYLIADEKMGIAAAEEALKSNASIPTRFVIDILSGTSAGGINGIFLAKALANGQDMDQLKELWIQEGDIDRLINDKKSVEQPLALQDPPESLLNSQRMYLELLKAFDGMDRKSNGKANQGNSSYVNEVDLFVTATDLQGVALPIRLADDVVYERRHRNVMHFIYSKSEVSGEPKDRNDFAAVYNPFLAYAARCTSAFPFAFEPMRLCDIDAIVEKIQGYIRDEKCKSGSDRWQPFFKDYIDPRGVFTVPFPKRSFGDGGYLDNKPFTYATETLSHKHADVPVDRKLIYIEPSPEHPEDETERERKPDAIENVMAALLTLPRYETIREDLQRVLERNRMIERINRVVEGVEHDAEHAGRTARAGDDITAPAEQTGLDLWAKPNLTDEEWATLDLSDMIKRKGRSYVAYHRLEIASTTDNLANLVARVAGFDEESDYFLIVRSLVRAWRDRTYVEYKSERHKKPTMNGFLHDMDLSYYLRRINFLRNKIDQLYRLDERARELVDLHVKGFLEGDDPQTQEREKAEFQQELLRIKRGLNEIYTSVSRQERLLRARYGPKTSKAQDETTMPVSPVYRDVMNLVKEINRVVNNIVTEPASGSAILDYFLGARTQEEQIRYTSSDRAASPQMGARNISDECVRRSKVFLDQYPEVTKLFDDTAETLKAHIAPAMREANEGCLELLSSTSTSADVSSGAHVVRTILLYYYQNYDDFDMITYPILYNTDMGEADMVEIIRISPEDAKALINEREMGCYKLAGMALGHFGAFLEQLWRQNDILWGRLDGAERIITALLPNHPQTRQLIGEAQAAIVYETIREMGPEELKQLIAESGMRTRTNKAEPKIVGTFIRNLKGEATDPDLQRALNDLIDDRGVRQYYLDTYKERSRLDPETALHSAARATTIVGKMLSNLSERRKVGNKYVAWVARLGQIFWALVEVAVPRRLPNLIFRHWLKLLYFFEVVLIIGSTLLVAKEVQQFALTAFGITAGVHLAVQILNDLMQSKNKWVNLIKAVGGVILVALIFLGIISLAAILGVELVWSLMERAKDWYASSPPFGWNSKTYARVGVGALLILFFFWVIRDDIKALFVRKRPASPVKGGTN